MGHYLSDFETGSEYWDRVIGQPMMEDWRRWRKEVRRGLVHTPEWVAKMEDNAKVLIDHGWKLEDY